DNALTCTLTSLTLAGSSTTPGASYSWTGPGIVSGANTANPTINAAGTYTLTVTSSANGCTASDVVVISNNTGSPEVNAGTDAELTCSISSISLNGSTSAASASYSWSGPGIVSGANSSSVLVNAAGTYTLVVTNNQNGCTASDQVLVTLNNTPPDVDAGNDQSITCTNTLATLTGSSTTPGATFTWSGPGIVSGINSSSANANVAGTYTLQVVNPANGCSASDQVEVTTNVDRPGAEAGTGNALTCVILEVQLNGNSTVNGAQYAWSGPGIVSGGNTANPTVNAIGTYTLTVTNPLNGCESTDTVVIEEGPCIIPYYQPCPGGKDTSKLGCELTSLYNNYLLVGLDKIQQIFFASPDTVWIEIITVEGQTQALFNLIYQTPGYGLTDTIPNGLNPLVLTGRYPIANLPSLLNVGIQDKIVYVRPVYPSINNSGIALTQGDLAQTSDIAREGFNVDGSGIKVCVLSDSYNTIPGNNAGIDIGNGDLPGAGNPAGRTTPVQVFKEYPYGQRSDE
ncbi:MAG: hypothetical protein ACKORE_00420, partial [Bacteroidota bacterium]